MNNLSTIDTSPKAIGARFDAMHPNGTQFSTPEEAAPRNSKDAFGRRVDRTLVRQLAVYSKFMVLLPDLDFSKK